MPFSSCAAAMQNWFRTFSPAARALRVSSVRPHTARTLALRLLAAHSFSSSFRAAVAHLEASRPSSPSASTPAALLPALPGARFPPVPPHLVACRSPARSRLGRAEPLGAGKCARGKVSGPFGAARGGLARPGAPVLRGRPGTRRAGAHRGGDVGAAVRPSFARPKLRVPQCRGPAGLTRRLLMWRRNYGQWLADTLPTMIDSVQVAKGELCIVVTTPAITHVMTFLRDHTNCQVRSRDASLPPPSDPLLVCLTSSSVSDPFACIGYDSTRSCRT